MRVFPTEDTVTRSKKPFVFTFSFFLSSIFLRFNLPPSIHISFVRVFVFLRFLLYFCCDFCPDSLAQARSRSIRSFLLLLLSLVFFLCLFLVDFMHAYSFSLSLALYVSLFLSHSYARLFFLSLRAHTQDDNVSFLRLLYLTHVTIILITCNNIQ